jgi:hypothetical protein
MRIARKLFLLSLTAIAAMAFAASSASAQNSIEVRAEATNTKCPTAPSGCPIAATGEIQLQGHVFGIESVASDCIVTFEGIVAGDGEGKVTKATLTDHPTTDSCQRTPCGYNAKDNTITPWPAHVNETDGFGSMLDSEFCIVNGSGQIQRCFVKLPITENPIHVYSSVFHTSGTNHLNAPGCEIEGQLTLTNDAAHPAIELVH